MDPARIAELLAPFLAPNAVESTRVCHSEGRGDEEPAFLSHTQLESISTYIDLLLRWNARINLTAIRDPEQIVTRHFGESLFAARHLFPRDARGRNEANHDADSSADRSGGRITLADVGSGAGFPGLPIKLWAPEITLTLIESNQKKVAFLREAIRTLTLTGVNIVAARAESLAVSAFDVVTLRAVEHFETTLRIAARLLAPGGRLALLVGPAQFDHAQSSLPELSWSTPQSIPLSHSRILVIASLG